MLRRVLLPLFWTILLLTGTCLIVAIINPSFSVSVRAEQFEAKVTRLLPIEKRFILGDFIFERGAIFAFSDDERVHLTAPFTIRPKPFLETRYEGTLTGSAKIKFADNSFFLHNLDDIIIKGSVVKSNRAHVAIGNAERALEILKIPKVDDHGLFSIEEVKRIATQVTVSSFESMPIYTLEEKWWYRIAGIMIKDIKIQKDVASVVLQPREISMLYLSFLGLLLGSVIVALASRLLRLSLLSTLTSFLFL
jgi:hypothetical protein